MLQENLLVNTMRLHDVDEQARLLPDWEQEYQQLGHGKFAGTLEFAQLRDFTLLRETSNKALHERVMPPDGQIVVGMCLSGDGASTFNGKVVGPDSLVVIDGRHSYDIRTEGHIELVGIGVQRDFFFSKVHEQDAAVAADALSATVTELDKRAAAMLRQYFVMVAELLQSGEGGAGLTPRMLASGAISNIALAVRLGQRGRDSEAIPRSQQRRERIVQQAIDYMRANASEEIGILDVCGATHVSRRTLQYCFEERLNISPLQYLKALRLNQARRQLKQLAELQRAHERENTIASVAALCGFHHASRFASDYKRLFGELPSQLKA